MRGVIKRFFVLIIVVLCITSAFVFVACGKPTDSNSSIWEDEWSYNDQTSQEQTTEENADGQDSTVVEDEESQSNDQSSQEQTTEENTDGQDSLDVENEESQINDQSSQGQTTEENADGQDSTVVEDDESQSNDQSSQEQTSAGDTQDDGNEQQGTADNTYTGPGGVNGGTFTPSN